MELKIPELALVVLIGPSGSGKSTFARRHFLPTEAVSSDYCRALVSDDENNQTASTDAFELLNTLVDIRLRRGLLTVVDATHVQPHSRQQLLEIAKRNYVLPVGIVFKLPEKVCEARNEQRTDRNFGPHVIRNQYSQLRRTIGNLKREGFRPLYFFESEAEVNAATVVREPLWPNRYKSDTGPFDVIGDVHGCFEELAALLAKLGYALTERPEEPIYRYAVAHPKGRKLVFVGDLVDRGPRTPDVLRLVMSAVRDGTALCVVGNHDEKLLKYFKGKNVQLKNGLELSVEQLAQEPEEFRTAAQRFLGELIAHYVLDDGKLVVAHAGLKERMHGRGHASIRDYAMYGETTGETDEFGLSVRLKWANKYKGQALVVYGHTPVYEPEWLNNTVDIDTGCVFGHKLTALRYPERELVSVPALATYAEAKRPLVSESATDAPSVQHAHDSLLDVQDVLGKQVINTWSGHTVLIHEDQAQTAFEIMNRWGINPKWLIYLPPTMSPVETSPLDGFLEHPAEAFAHFRAQGVAEVVCQEKHMGSRAVVIVCRDESAAQAAFGIAGEGIGVVYTRTGRAFFPEKAMEQAFLTRIRDGLTRAGFWENFDTDWVCLDCELMPWSAKAQALLKDQYAAVGVAGVSGLSAADAYLTQAAGRGLDVARYQTRVAERLPALKAYQTAYRRYCWPVDGLEGYRLAPFHILAVRGRHFGHETHRWQMEQLHEICAAANEPILMATPFWVVNLNDPALEEWGTNAWLNLINQGGEGMVVKPMTYITRTAEGKLVQPALKVRGPEYLRIIYGAEYTLPHNRERLRKRAVGGKRSLAIREFTLGIEGLERFLRNEPLRRVHQCAFGVLALESEPIDPRL